MMCAYNEAAMANYAAFLEPDETAYDLFARVVVDPVRTGVPFLDQAVFLRPRHVVEIIGPCGCGKSETLAQVSGSMTVYRTHGLLVNVSTADCSHVHPAEGGERRYL